MLPVSRMFVASCKRLRLMKSSEAVNLGNFDELLTPPLFWTLITIDYWDITWSVEHIDACLCLKSMNFSSFFSFFYYPFSIKRPLHQTLSFLQSSWVQLSLFACCGACSSKNTSGMRQWQVNQDTTSIKTMRCVHKLFVILTCFTCSD